MDFAAKCAALALWVCLTVLPLDFYPGVPFETYFVKLIYIATFGAAALSPFVLPGSVDALRIFWLLAAAYALRLAVMLVSLAWSPAPADAALILIVNLAGFVLSMALFLMASRLTLSQLADVVTWGAAGGVAAFHLFLLVGHAMRGGSGIAVLLDALLSGDLPGIKRYYFFDGLRGLGVAGFAGVWGNVAPKITNALGHALLTPAIAAWYLVAADRMLNGRVAPARDWAARLVLANAVFIALMSFSTRVQLYFAIIVILNVAYFVFRHGNPKVRMMSASLSIFTAILAVVYLIYNVSVQGGVLMFVADVLDDPRFNDFFMTLARLRNAGLFGEGFGADLGFMGLNYEYAHNLFLSDFLAAGFVGLVGSIFWAGSILYFAVVAWSRAFDRKRHPGIQMIYLAGLLPLLYTLSLTQLAAMGLFDISDWVGFTVGLVALAKAINLDPTPTVQVKSGRQRNSGPRMSRAA